MSFAMKLHVPEHLARGKEVRVAGTQENPLFCLADVCKVLGIANTGNVASRLREDGELVDDIHTVDVSGRTQEMAHMTEAGLYSVVLTSRADNAKPFRKWVCGEVLPCIRKHGCYPAPAEVPVAVPVARPAVAAATLDALVVCRDILLDPLASTPATEADRELLKAYARRVLGAPAPTPQAARDQRVAAAGEMRAAGTSFRGIAETTGTSKTQARKDALDSGAAQPDAVKGRDGKTYPGGATRRVDVN